MSPSPIYIGANATGWLSFYDPARTEQKARGSYPRPYPLTQPDQLRPGRCLSWVIFRPRAALELGPFIPQQQTCGDRIGLSVPCQKRSFDDVVGSQQKRVWDGQTD